MPTTFDVISLGVNADLDTTEGNFNAENAGALVGLTFGGPGNALAGQIQEFSPGSSAFDSDGNTYYDQNDATPETFRIDGGADQGFDSSVVYNATITFLDGSTANVTAVIFQDTAGNTYLAPEFSNNADTATYNLGSIESLTLDSLLGSNFLGMTGDRISDTFVPCFTEGTLIEAEGGPVPVESLLVGDLVQSRDNGLVPIRWIGQVQVPARGDLAPVQIRAGSFGQDLPLRDLVVSPQHRMLLNSRIAKRMFDCDEVLVAAKKLLDYPGISRVPDGGDVTYIHLLFDQHEIIFAEGAPTESLLLGEQVLTTLNPDAAEELERLFPELYARPAVPARLVPKGRQVRRLLDRHERNGKPLLLCA